MNSSSYVVAGMTCQHCVTAVTAEIGQLPGVREVRVDLDTGRVEVDSDTVVRDEDVSAAVVEAGYRLADAT